MKKVIKGLLIAVFVFSTVMLLRQWKDNAAGAAVYEDAAALAHSAAVSQTAQPQPSEPRTLWVPAPVEGDPVMDQMAEINLAALREANPDVAGWIRIPDTHIDYPIMQGEDNDFYLNHTWDKQPNSVGSIFLEHLNSESFKDYNTIIYGHNMKNNSMFGDLEDYAVKDYWKKHPYVYIATDAGVYRYEVFAFYQAEVESLTYSINPQREDTKEDFLTLALESSRFDTGIVPALTDRILTLSTCSGGGYTHRYVLQARLVMTEVTK